MLPECKLEYNYVAEDEYYDKKVGVDLILSVTSSYIKNQRMPIDLWIQERWRPIKYHKYHEITLTEWNNTTGEPSEIYKVKAGLLLYGYVNGDFRDPYTSPTQFYEVIAVALSQLFYDAFVGTTNLKLSENINERTEQSFRVMPIDPYSKWRVWYRNYEKNWELPKKN